MGAHRTVSYLNNVIDRPTCYNVNLYSVVHIDAQPAPRPPIRPFDPTDHDLDANFRLTRFADLKG